MKILVVEDDDSVRVGLTKILTHHHYQVDVAQDGQAALDQAQQLDYDVILLDLMLPKINGIQVCQHLRLQGSSSAILLLTARDSATDRVLGLDSGADDYVVKPFDTEELLARIRALLRRGKAVGSAVLSWGALSLDAALGEVTAAGHPLRLTPKEYGLLELFLLNPKRVFSRRAILDHLWDGAEAPGEETVSTHIKCLRQKLKAAGSEDLVETVHGLGYRLKAPPEAKEVTQQTEDKTARETVQHPQQAAAALSQTTDWEAKAAERPSGAQPQRRRSRAAQVAAADLPSPQAPLSARTEPDRLLAYQAVQAHKQKIWDKFKEQFLARVEVVEQATIALAHNHLTPALQDRAKQEAHKLAGSLGIFDCLAGSAVARQLEEWLQPQVQLQSVQAPQMSAWVQQLRQHLHTNHETLHGSVAAGEPSLAHPSGSGLEGVSTRLLHILMVDDDEILAAQLSEAAVTWGLTMAVARDLATARQVIAQTAPDGVLLDLSFPGQEDGLDLLEELGARSPQIPVVVFTGRGELSDRLAVVRRGGATFLHKPLPSYEILGTLAQVVAHRPSDRCNRVLVLAHTPEASATLTQLLQPWGVEVTGLVRTERIWHALETVVPNLLVLDWTLPLGASELEGVELCQMVRSDPRWQAVAIVFWSLQPPGNLAAEAIDRAFAAGADDVLGASCSDADVVTRLLQRLRRMGFQPLAQDSSTL